MVEALASLLAEGVLAGLSFFETLPKAGESSIDMSAF